MNEKHIRNHLRKKIDNWLKSIDDETLVAKLKVDIIVTGGSIVSLLQGEEPHDYDVYFKTKKVTKEVAKYYVKQFNDRVGSIKNKIGYYTQAFVLDGETIEEDLKTWEGWNWGSDMLKIEPERVKIIVRSDGVAGDKEEGTDDEEFSEMMDAPRMSAEEIMVQADDIPQAEIEKQSDKKDKTPYRPVFLSPNAISLSDKIQLVIRFYGDAATIHENYDFVHCTNYYDYYTNTVHLNPKALVSIMNKELIYQGSKYPIASIIRIRKFLKRGWYINAGQILKMCFQTSQLDLTDPIVLEDQLVGVDTIYFMHLIGDLQERVKENEKFEVSNEYFLSVVDKVFNE